MTSGERFRRCWVVGAGVMGSALAAELHRQGGAEVHLVGQSLHLRRVRQEGLWVEFPGREPQLLRLRAELPGEVPRLSGEDLVILAVKATALAETAFWLRERLSPRSGVLALQNGMGIRELLAESLGRPAARGLFFMGALGVWPGRVRVFPGRGIRLAPSPEGQALCAWLQGSGLQCRPEEDFAAVSWRKLAINCVANPLAGLLDCGNRHLVRPVLDPVKDAILDEVRRVARAHGVELDLDAAAFNSLVTPDNTPSLRIDLLRGKPTEIDFLNGAVVRLGAEVGVATPVNQTLVSLVRFLEGGAGG